MERKLLFLAVILLLTAITPKKIYAQTSASSAALAFVPVVQEQGQDNRAKILQSYLASHNSPLAHYSNTIINEADKNNLDWRLIPAIAGVESTFGQFIPSNSYNGWGFGIYGDNVRRFASWEDGISTVSKSLHEDYINKNGAKNIYAIGAMYAADPGWAYKVQHFMDDIDLFRIKNVSANSLSISL